MSDSIEARIEALLAKMTLPEKIGQTNMVLDVDAKDHDAIRSGRIGASLFSSGIYGGQARSVGVSMQKINESQKVAVEESRLGIPILFGRDVIHGFRTIFPIPLAQAASWSPDLAEEGSKVAAREAAAVGLKWTFAPMLDIARDPRWGRIAEGYGEDPYLCSRMGEATVRGFQGKDPGAPDRVLSTAKHYAGYGGAEGGRDYNTVEVTEQTFQDIYLPSFRAAVKAGVCTVMSSFNEIGGVPSVANRRLLTDLLKDEMQFDGLLFSDWEAVLELMRHGIAADLKDAAALSANAGLDMDMISYGFINHLEELVKSGVVPEGRIDDAVRRVLRAKFRAGLFDRPYADLGKADSVVLAPEHRTYARKSAAETMVLLKNRNGLLPLAKNPGSIAVVGPMAHVKGPLLGSWAMDGVDTDAVSVIEGIKAKLAPGAFLWPTEVEVDHALQACSCASVIVAVVGEHPERSGESHSTSTLDLPPGHEAFLKALREYDIPLVVVVLAGRPLSIKWLNDMADAVLYAWHPGIEGGNAVADVLFGDVNPSAKLPVTFPRTVGQVPIYYNHKPTGRPLPVSGRGPSRYADLPNSPLFPFGYGLSYTTFTYTNLRVSPAGMGLQSGSIRVSAIITNTGEREGTEVVQLYVRDELATLSRPVRELKGFTRVTLKPGESREVCFDLAASELTYCGLNGRPTVEPGNYKVWIAPCSDTGLEGSFVVKVG